MRSLNPKMPQLTYHKTSSADCLRVRQFLEHSTDARCSPEYVTLVWPQLLDAGSLIAVSVEDSDGQIISLGASAFVKTDWVDALTAGEPPFAAERLMCEALTPRSAIASPADIAAANAHKGTAVFVIYTQVLRTTPSESAAAAIKAQLMTGFMTLHAGYNIDRLLVEAFGEEERSMYVSGSAFRIVNDYSQYALAEPRPCLVGLTRGEVWSMQMHPLLPFFQQQRSPRFGFSAAERALLSAALDGDTDDAVARALDVPLSAVKQRWVRLFERTRRMGESFTAELHTSDSGRRGAQKRHRLLRYLRAHPEELSLYERKRRPNKRER
jgi:hypothetical protein